jgi:hypothetical protein
MASIKRDVFKVERNVQISALQETLNAAARTNWRLIALIPRRFVGKKESVHLVWAKSETITVKDPVDAIIETAMERDG